jgi:hypothetical protein
VAAGSIGITAATLGAFVVFIAGALQALDGAPLMPTWVTDITPPVAVASAILATVLARSRPRVSAGLFAIAALLLAAPIVGLGLRPALLAIPIFVLGAAALAWYAPRAAR